MSNKEFTEDQKEVLNSFERKILDGMSEEPPEVRRKVNDHIWDLFHDSEEVFEDPPQLSITVEWSDEDEAFMALEHNRDASAFAQTPAQALREMATVIELLQDDA